ncbi:hypothetical protein Q9233_008387 [Columba guinea]|nr:hypothetical protein Q9233_008387 [Columba guinea]
MDRGRAGKFQYNKHHTPAPEIGYFVPVFFRPGTYEAEKQLHKKLTWPMKFGSPDWSLVPMPATRMLKTEVQKVRTGARWEAPSSQHLCVRVSSESKSCRQREQTTVNETIPVCNPVAFAAFEAIGH